MTDYRKLLVWKKSHTSALIIYKLTTDFPKSEQFGITSQIRRAAVSIPTNIAEGSGKFTQRDFANYLQTSFGSAQEVEYLSFLSFELGYFTKEKYDQSNKCINEVKAMLISLIKKVRSN